MSIFGSPASDHQKPLSAPCWVTVFRYRRQIVFTALNATATINIGDSFLAVMRTLLMPQLPSTTASNSPATNLHLLPFVPRVLNSPFGPIHITPGPSPLIESVMGRVPADVVKEIEERERRENQNFHRGDTYDGYDEDGNPISPPLSGSSLKSSSTGRMSSEPFTSRQHSSVTSSRQQQQSVSGQGPRYVARPPTEHMPLTVVLPNLHIELYFDAPCDATSPHTSLAYPTGPVQLLAIVMQNNTRELNLLFSNERSIATSRPQTTVMAGLPPPAPPSNSPALKPGTASKSFSKVGDGKGQVASPPTPTTSSYRRPLSMTAAISAAGPSRRGRLLPTLPTPSANTIGTVSSMFAPPDGSYQWYHIAFQCQPPRSSDSSERHAIKKKCTQLGFYFKIPAHLRDRFVPERSDHPSMYVDSKGRAVPFVASLAVLWDEPFTPSYRFHHLHNAKDSDIASRLLSLLSPERSDRFLSSVPASNGKGATRGDAPPLLPSTFDVVSTASVANNALLLVPGFGAIFSPSGAFLAIDYTTPQTAALVLGQPQSVIREIPEIVVQSGVLKGDVVVGENRGYEGRQANGMEEYISDEWEIADNTAYQPTANKNLFQRSTGFHAITASPGYIMTYPKLGIDLHFSPTTNSLRFITIHNPNANFRNVRDAALRYQQPTYCMWISPLRALPPPATSSTDNSPIPAASPASPTSDSSEPQPPTLLHPWKKWLSVEASLTNGGRLRSALAPNIAQYHDKKLKQMLKVVSLGGALVCADTPAGSSLANPQALASSKKRKTIASPLGGADDEMAWGEYLGAGDNITCVFVFRGVDGSTPIGDHVRHLVLEWGGSIPSSGFLTCAAKAKVSEYLWAQTPEGGGYGNMIQSTKNIDPKTPSGPLPEQVATQIEDFFTSDVHSHKPSDNGQVVPEEKIPPQQSSFDPFARSNSDLFQSGGGQPPTAPTSGVSSQPSSSISRMCSPTGGLGSSGPRRTPQGLEAEILEVVKPHQMPAANDNDGSSTVPPPIVDFFESSSTPSAGYRYGHIDPYPSKPEAGGVPTSGRPSAMSPPPSLFGRQSESLLPPPPPPLSSSTSHHQLSPRRGVAATVLRVGSVNSWDDMSMDASHGVGESTATAAPAPVARDENKDDDADSYEDDFVDDVYHSCNGSGHSGEVPSLIYSEALLRGSPDDNEWLPPTTSKRFQKNSTETVDATSPQTSEVTRTQSTNDTGGSVGEASSQQSPAQPQPQSDAESPFPSSNAFNRRSSGPQLGIGEAATSTASMGAKTVTTPTNTYRSSSPKEKHTSGEASPSPSAEHESWQKAEAHTAIPMGQALVADEGEWWISDSKDAINNIVQGQNAASPKEDDEVKGAVAETPMYTPYSVMSPLRSNSQLPAAGGATSQSTLKQTEQKEDEVGKAMQNQQVDIVDDTPSTSTSKGKKKGKKGKLSSTVSTPNLTPSVVNVPTKKDAVGEDASSVGADKKSPEDKEATTTETEHYDWNDPRRNSEATRNATADWVQRLPQHTAASSTVSSTFQTPEISPNQGPIAPDATQTTTASDTPDDQFESFRLPPANSNNNDDVPPRDSAPTPSGSVPPKSGDSYLETPPQTKTQIRKQKKLQRALQLQNQLTLMENGDEAQSPPSSDKIHVDDQLPTSVINALRKGGHAAAEGATNIDTSSQSQEQIGAAGTSALPNRSFYTPYTSSPPATPEHSLSRQGANTPPQGTVTAVGSPSSVKKSEAQTKEEEEAAWGETPETASPATTSPSTTPPLKPKNASGSASVSSKGKGKKKGKK